MPDPIPDTRETLDPALIERCIEAAMRTLPCAPDTAERVTRAVLSEAAAQPPAECDDHLSGDFGGQKHWCTRPLGHRGWHRDGTGVEWRVDAVVAHAAAPPPAAITAEDVDAALDAWDETWTWHGYAGDRAAFVADYLNRRRDR